MEPVRNRKAVLPVTLALLLGWHLGLQSCLIGVSQPAASNSQSYLVLTPTCNPGLDPPSRLVVGSSWAGLGLDPQRVGEASQEGSSVLGVPGPKPTGLSHN